jgi:hypothetical protein
MGAYDARRATLDPGLTALALRARRQARGYPFLEEATRARGGSLARLAALAARVGLRRRRRRADAAPTEPGPRQPI